MSVQQKRTRTVINIKIAWRHYPPILNYLYTASYLFFFHQQMNFESQGTSIFLQNSRKKSCLFLSKPFNKILIPCLFFCPLKQSFQAQLGGGGLVFFGVFFNLFLIILPPQIRKIRVIVDQFFVKEQESVICHLSRSNL